MKLKPLKFACLLSALCAATADAEPHEGIAVSGGLASYSLSGNTTVAPVTPLSYTTSGIGFGVDYQLPLGGNISLNPFWLSSGESASGTATPGLTSSHSALGLQLRYWLGDIFLGAQVANHSEILYNRATSTALYTTGSGGGVTVGWEDPQGGMLITGQYDTASISNVNAKVTLKGFRMSVGYRWK